MSTRIIAEFENIDSAETAARLIRYRINDVHAVRLNSREEIHDVRRGDVTMAFPINDDVSIAPVPLMSSYGSAGTSPAPFTPTVRWTRRSTNRRCGKTPSSPWR